MMRLNSTVQRKSTYAFTGPVGKARSDFGFWWLSFNDKRGLAGSCLSSNHTVRLPDGATLVAVPF